MCGKNAESLRQKRTNRPPDSLSKKEAPPGSYDHFLTNHPDFIIRNYRWYDPYGWQKGSRSGYSSKPLEWTTISGRQVDPMVCPSDNPK